MRRLFLKAIESLMTEQHSLFLGLMAATRRYGGTLFNPQGATERCQAWLNARRALERAGLRLSP